MAGMIEVRPGVLWSTSSWMFSFVLRTLGAEVTDPQVAEALTEIEDHNLGYLSLPDLPSDQRTEVARVIRECLMARAESDLPPDMNERTGVVEYIRGLVDVLAASRWTTFLATLGAAPRGRALDKEIESCSR